MGTQARHNKNVTVHEKRIIFLVAKCDLEILAWCFTENSLELEPSPNSIPFESINHRPRNGISSQHTFCYGGPEGPCQYVFFYALDLNDHTSLRPSNITNCI